MLRSDGPSPISRGSEGAPRDSGVAPDPLGTQLEGAAIFVDANQHLARLPATSDLDGWSEVLVPGTLTAPGSRLYAQFVFESTAACAGGGSWSASQALEITVQ